MLAARVPTFLLVAAVALAGACTKARHAGSPEVASTPEPAPIDPPSAAEARPWGPTSAVESPLRVVAVREGDVTLLRQREAPLLVIDGEPLALVDGTFARHPVGSAGLWNEPDRYDEEAESLAAASLDDPLGGWTSVAHPTPRATPLRRVYRRSGEQWQQERLRKGLLMAYYAALVERDGALLALRSWAPDAIQEVAIDDGFTASEVDAYRARLRRALARTRQAWVRVGGSEAAPLPRIPAKTTLTGHVTTTADGTLLALAHADEGPGVHLLRWRPRQADAERVALPGIDHTTLHVLGGGGEWSFVGAIRDDGERESYLALGRGDQWERVRVSLPGRPSSASAAISGAARLPDGELWIALGHRSSDGGDRQPVWRKPVDGPWQPVPLPTVDGDAFGPAIDWVYDFADERGWTEIDRSPDPTVPEQALHLVEAGGAVWVVVQGREADPAVAFASVRTLVLTTAAGEAPPVVLPPGWQLALERRNHALPPLERGLRQCKPHSITLGPAALLHDAPQLAESLRMSLEAPDEEPAHVRSVYVARRDGREVLVAEARAGSPGQRVALREGVARAMASAGLPTDAVAEDCRIPLVERMVATLVEP